MQHRAAIIDNVALANLAELTERTRGGALKHQTDFAGLVPNVFAEIHVPAEVKNEFGRYGRPSLVREQMINSIDRGARGFRLCTSYDSVLLGLIRPPADPRVDAGEAEAIAQLHRLSIRWFITDDSNCRRYVREKWRHIHCIGTLALLAALDLLEYLPDRDAVLRLFLLDIHPKSRHERNAELSGAYFDAADLLGIALTPREYGERIKPRRIFEGASGRR